MTESASLFHTYVIVGWSARSDRRPVRPSDDAIWWAVYRTEVARRRRPTTPIPVKLLFNVLDIEATADALETTGVSVAIRREPWGSVGDFIDPDGNRCALRDEGSFFPSAC